MPFRFVSFFVALFVCSALYGAPQIQLKLDRQQGLYKCGENAAFAITLLDDAKQPLKQGELRLKLTRDGVEVIQEKVYDLTKEVPTSISETLNTPGFLRLEAEVMENGKRSARNVAGAGYDVEKIRPVENLPADFEAFWSTARANAAKLPLDPVVTPHDGAAKAGFSQFRVAFAAPGGHVYGFMSVPEGPGPFPALLSVPGAGQGEAGPEFRPGAITMTMNVLPYAITNAADRDAQYKAMEAKLSKYRYWYEGFLQGREAYFFYRPIIGISLAASWLATQPNVKPGGIGYYGFSQGGAFGLILTAITPEIREAVSHMPALCDHLGIREKRASGWPGLAAVYPMPEVEKTSGYYDAVNFARLIKDKPVTVLVGFADTTCPPTTVYAAYNVMPSPDKKMVNEVPSGHGRGGNYWGAVNAMTERLKR